MRGLGRLPTWRLQGLLMSRLGNGWGQKYSVILRPLGLPANRLILAGQQQYLNGGRTLQTLGED